MTRACLAVLAAVLCACRRQPPQQGAEGGPARALPTAAAMDSVFDAERPAGYEEVVLVRKDRAYQEVPYRSGDARGRFWYQPGRAPFAWRVRVSGLEPGGAYWLMLRVDGVDYGVAALWADGRGEIGGADSLIAFADRVCKGASPRRPTPVTGRHRVQAWLRRAPAGFGGSDVVEPNAGDPCSHDGSDAVLFERRAIELEVVRR